MKITIVMSDESRHAARLPYVGATHVEIDLACPHGCTVAHSSLKLSGSGIERTTRDTYYAPAVALCCKRRVGIIETKVETLFGVEEDERVLRGPWKVL